MSGHSKWSTIKRKKEKTDSQRAKIFTKIGREISVAVKEGGPDPAVNGKLRDLISKAKSNNVPNDNIERIIKKASAEGDKNDYETIFYEGYGPCGVAVIVEALTDNRNRTAGDLRHYFDKFGGNLGQNGCVSFMFEQRALLLLKIPVLMKKKSWKTVWKLALPILNMMRTLLKSLPTLSICGMCGSRWKEKDTHWLLRKSNIFPVQ